MLVLLMNYVVNMGSGDMTYVHNIIKIGSGIQKLLAEIRIDTQTARWSHNPTLIFQNKESRLIQINKLRTDNF
jgi:hypothetical protein